MRHESPSLAVQRALFARLRGAVVVPVYDVVPEKAAAPYLILGDETSNDWSTKDRTGRDIIATVHVISEAPGLTEAKTLLDQIVQAVTREALDLESGWKAPVVYLDTLDVFQEDQTTRHGVARFKIKTTKEV